MSVEATCCLAGIPDIGLRMQTLRITEFFLLINSGNCISGRTTLARLCALKHKSPAQMELVLQQLFDKDTKINHRKENRLGDPVKWMKNLSLHITEKGEDKSDILEKINSLAQVLRRTTIPNPHILVYTDGSTETRRRKSKNSGYGICITSSTHSPIFLGGGTVRSDGNNFIAEMAAAAVAIKALPPRQNHDHVHRLNGYYSSTTTRPCLGTKAHQNARSGLEIIPQANTKGKKVTTYDASCKIT